MPAGKSAILSIHQFMNQLKDKLINEDCTYPMEKVKRLLTYSPVIE